MKRFLIGSTMALVFGVSTLSGAVVTSWRKTPDENGKIRAGGERTSGVGSAAEIKAIPATLSFQINVKEKMKSAWCTAGINIFISNKDWLQIALHDIRGKRTVEVTQVKDGRNTKDGLGEKEILTDNNWEYNTEYTVNAEFLGDAINLRMTDAEGKVIQQCKIPITELPRPLQGGKLTFRVCYAIAELGTVNLQ